ncbi:MAG: polymer-forming cytoskeletal protein [Pseudomonadota bacterium]
MAKPKSDTGVTLIAPSTRLAGDITFVEQLFVNGRIEGNVYADPESQATVVVAEGGSIAGEIRVPNVIVNGSVEGDVHAGAKVELAAKARVRGNVYYRLMEMQMGATVEGQMVHEEVASAAPDTAKMTAAGPAKVASSASKSSANLQEVRAD